MAKTWSGRRCESICNGRFNNLSSSGDGEEKRHQVQLRACKNWLPPRPRPLSPVNPGGQPSVLKRGRSSEPIQNKKRRTVTSNIDDEVQVGDHGKFTTSSTCLNVVSSVSQRSSHLTTLSKSVLLVDDHSPSLDHQVKVHDGSDLDLSPARAVRVAMLKSRFASTIVKAQQDIDHSTITHNNVEAEAKIAKFRATEIAKANDLIKKQRQRDREAARLALSEMEKNVVIEDNFRTMKEFQMLIYGATFN
ncbi:unnamed protein product [Prunus armeniaca]|uniref:No apical meristem-associated C-terminal domain-containing protein n=1 Tax=Prunus armeniaca TaxID=36596 RepID=A0A6J5WYU9_PRUAR|nr:unnamed protein product [Prunus armeniaca]